MLESRQNTRPYPGLRPFEPWEEEIFFGRKEHTNRLLDILQQQRFLAVIGPSGSGKSSLVRAGLLPTLPLGFIGTGSDWRIAIMRPGHQPIQRLAQSLLSRSVLGIELVGENYLPENDQTPTAEAAIIAAELRRGPLGLIQVVKNARARQKNKEAFNLLVLVDQFEEIFTYVGADGKHADESEAFVNLLLASRSVKEAQIFIALTMRTDFLGNCVRFLELPDAINRAQYLTPRLTREQIQSAITEPAQVFEGNVELTLVAELINAVSDDPDQLPILQHALARMWDIAIERDPEHKIINWDDFKHEKIGGIANALPGHADEILKLLSPNHEIEEPLSPMQHTAEILFRAITDQRSAEEGGQAVRRPQTLERIAEWSGKEWQNFKPVLEAYTKEGVNFLRTNATFEPETERYIFDKNTEVDISHEALIRQWKRLLDWVAQEARFADEYKRLLDRALDWRNAEDNKPGSGSLLTGADLARALEWQRGQCGTNKTDTDWQPNPLWADRYRKEKEEKVPNTEFAKVSKFIEDSNAVVLREKEQKRKNRMKELRDRKRLIVLTICCILAMLSATVFAVLAKISQANAKEALAKVLWSPLDFTEQGINKEQAAGLLELSRADDSMKQVFLDQLSDKTHLDHFNNNPAPIVRAIAGISPKKNKELSSYFDTVRLANDDLQNNRLKVLIDIELGKELPIKEMLDATGSKTDEVKSESEFILEEVGQRIPKLAVDEVDPIVDQIIAADAVPGIYYPNFSSVLKALVSRSPETLAEPIVDKFVIAIKKTTNSRGRETLSHGLVSVAKEASATKALVIFDKLLAAMKEAEAPDKGYYRPGLLAVVEKVPETEAGTIISKLSAALKEAKDSYQREDLAKALAAVAKKVPDAQVTGIFDQFYSAMLASKDSYERKALAKGLETIAKKVPKEQFLTIFNQYFAEMKKAKDSDKANYRPGVLAIAEIAPDKANVAVFNKLLEAMKAAKGPDKPYYYSEKLSVLAEKVPENEAGAILNKLSTALIGAIDSYQREDLVKALAAIAKRIPKEQFLTIFNQFFTEMEKAKDSDKASYRSGLFALAEKAPDTEAVQVFNKLNTALREAKGSYLREDLAKALAAVAKKVPDVQAAGIFDQFFSALSASKDRYESKALIRGLETIAKKVPADHILDKFKNLISTLKNKKVESSRSDDAINMTTANSKPASNDKIEEVVYQFLDTMKNTNDSNQPVNYITLLSVLVEKAPEEQAGKVIEKLLSVMKNAKNTNDEPVNYIAVLPALANKVPYKEALNIFTKLFDQMKSAENSSQKKIYAMALEAISRKITAEADVDSVIDKLFIAINDDKANLEYFTYGILGATSFPANADPLAQKLAKTIDITGDPDQIKILCESLMNVSARLKNRDDAAKFLFNSMKNPLTPRDLLAKAIRDRFPDERKIKEELGYWKLIAWGMDKGLITL